MSNKFKFEFIKKEIENKNNFDLDLPEFGEDLEQVSLEELLKYKKIINQPKEKVIKVEEKKYIPEQVKKF